MSDLLPLFEEQPVEVNTWPDRPRILRSYVYATDDMLIDLHAKGVDIAIDSGAFTAENSGKPIDHDAYLDWLDGHSDKVTFALSLDVIGDPWSSRVNHEKAVDKLGDKVRMVPTWHFGSSLTHLTDLCRSYDYVAIGGAVPYAKQIRQLFAAASEAHRIAADHGTMLHGLGMTGGRILFGLPWMSVDSSTWTTAVRFPTLRLAQRDGFMYGFEHSTQLDAIARSLVRQYGGDPALVAQKGWSMATVCPDKETHVIRRQWALSAGARTYMYVEHVKNQTNPHRPIRVYLAGSAPDEIPAILTAHALGSPWVEDPLQTAFR